MKQAGLEILFDFQRFWRNAHLESLAEETVKRYCPELPDRKMSYGEASKEGMSASELADDELAFVSAAGEPEMMESAINLLREEDGSDG